MARRQTVGEYRQHILVIRLSALGDVAILQPVMRQRAEANRDVLFTLAGPPRLQSLFGGMDNVRYLPMPKRQTPREIYTQLKTLKPDKVADMHHVLRTIGVGWLFRMHGVPVYSIHKRIPRNMPSWKRYDEVFRRCGLQEMPQGNESHWPAPVAGKREYTIGVAPFTQHEGKQYPLPMMEQVVRQLAMEEGHGIVLFGSAEESEVLQSWAERYAHVENLAGKLPFDAELQRIASLDVMVSMDSANMHFASCYGVPVVSIWGATHPCRGFYGWRQNPDWAVQTDMPCRPCSKFGNKPCRKGGYPCMTNISAETIVGKVRTLIGKG